MEENFSFGYWLHRQRLARDLRQADLAVQLGIAPITLRKIEADERRPSLQLIIRVAELFALSEAERTILLQVARADLSPAALPMPERARDDQPAEISASTPTVLPTGTVTLLLAEIEHAAALWERYPDLIRGALARSIACFQTAVAAHGGVVWWCRARATRCTRPFHWLSTPYTPHWQLSAHSWPMTGAHWARCGWVWRCTAGWLGHLMGILLGQRRIAPPGSWARPRHSANGIRW